MSEPCSASADSECITCGDTAIPLTVLAIIGTDAHCRDAAGRTETVAIELVGPVAAGDRLLVHAGVAIQTLPPEPGAQAGPRTQQNRSL